MKFELKKPYQHYTDTELAEDLRRVASVTGRPTVTQDDYETHGHYSQRCVAERFGSWVMALERAGLNTDHAKAATAESLKEDLRRVAAVLGRDYVTLPDYAVHGKWSERPFYRVFGNWSKALAAAGLGRHPNAHQRASNEDLLVNLERVWTHLGRQPRCSEMKSPLSRYSENTYLNRFGTWRKALKSFIVWVEAEEPEETQQSLLEASPLPDPPSPPETNFSRRKKRTPRIANLRIGFRVMRRDNFTCRACGRSPSLYPGLF